jgi:hypothetical protein
MCAMVFIPAVSCPATAMWRINLRYEAGQDHVICSVAEEYKRGVRNAVDVVGRSDNVKLLGNIALTAVCSLTQHYPI